MTPVSRLRSPERAARGSRGGTGSLVVVVILVLCLTVPSGYAAVTSLDRAGEARRAVGLAYAARATGDLVRVLQVERGLTAITVEGGDGEAAARLAGARVSTDEAVERWRVTPGDLVQGSEAIGRSGVPALLAELPGRRARADRSRGGGSDGVFTWYTDVVAALLREAGDAMSAVETVNGSEAVLGYLGLLQVTEALGYERGYLGGLIAAGEATGEEAVTVVLEQRAQREATLRLVRGRLSDRELAAVTRLETTTQADTLAAWEAAIVARDAGALADLRPLAWFDVVSRLADGYADLAAAEVGDFAAAAEAEAASLARQAALYAVGSALVLVAGLVAGLVLLLRARRAQRAHEQQQAEAASRFQAWSDPALHVSADGVVHRVNDAFAEAFGAPVDSFAGAVATDLLRCEEEPATPDEAVAGSSDPVSRPASLVGKVQEARAVRADGTVFPVEIVTAIMNSEEGLYAMVLRDISDRVALLEELRERAAALARSNEELEHFAYAASHDLQEPLRKLAGYARMLEEDHADSLDEDGRVLVASMGRASERMRGLIADVLALSRVSADRMVSAPCDLSSLVKEVLADLDVSVREADADVRVGELPTVPGDRAQLRQVFQNVISNSIKYRSERPLCVTVRARTEEGGWVVEVADNGVGFRQQYSDRIFRIFQRLVGRHEYAGTGIGLALAAKVVANHEGRIWATSEPGVGTTLHVWLPSSAAVPAPRQGEPAAGPLHP